MRVKLVGFLTVLAIMLGTSAAWAVEAAPASFTLSARGPVKKPRDIGLVVFRQPEHTEIGAVPLGTFSGRPSIHWKLKVHGKLLGSGSYLISLRVFANGKPTSIPAPHPRKLTISGQHVRVS